MKLNLGKWDVFKHGISVSLLEDWLACRELARYRCVGLKPKRPSTALTFGNIGHDILKTAHRAIANGKVKGIPGRRTVKRWVALAEDDWRKQNPRADKYTLEGLELSLAFAEAVMPVYFEWWHRDLFKMEWEAVEDWLRVDFEINWGGGLVKVPMLGKLDGVFKRSRFLWLLETKTKSRIDEGVLVDTLPMNLQVHFYILALEIMLEKKLRGVLYNVIRRPSLRQGKHETIAAFAKRCVEDVEARPEWYFLRYEIVIGKEDVERFRKEFELMLREFLSWAHFGTSHYRNTSNCENKYGKCNFLPVCANGDFTDFYQIKRRRD